MRVETSLSPALQSATTCRFCGGALHGFLDLGMSPLCESFVPREKLNEMEAFYPLTVFVCTQCKLVQLQDYVDPAAIFTEYAYYSSFSDSYLAHGRTYTDMIIERQGLSKESLVVELASNDGYLLQHFVAREVPVLGIEPAVNCAKAAIARGVPTHIGFFDKALGQDFAAQGRQADLVIGNNVLAQVPDINTFVAGIKAILKPGGIATIEFPHLVRLMEDNQFDTIYHEHFSYFSVLAARAIFARHGLVLFDVETIWTHGGSLRIYLAHEGQRTPLPSVADMLEKEEAFGLSHIATYDAFGRRVVAVKHKLLDFLIKAKQDGKTVAGYGAPGKAATLLNYCGIRTDFLDFTVDRNPYKHGKYMPGTHVPIFAPDKIAETKPDYVMILPWNLKDEIIAQLDYIRAWGGKFVVPIPDVAVID